MSKGYWKIILAGLLLVASFLLEIKQKAAFGRGFDLILVALIVLPLFLDLGEFLLFGAFGFFVAKLIYPWSGLEMVLLIAFPVLAFIFQKIFPWKSWLEPFILVTIGILGFYGLTGPAIFFGDISFLFLDLFISMIYGWAIYYFLAVFTERRT